jgi:hypothetical protein
MYPFFNTVQSGLASSLHALLGTPLVHGSRQLNCLIEGESIVFPVTFTHDCVVGEFKEVIQSKSAPDTLKDVGPHTLELWKVSTIDDSRCEVTWIFSAQRLQLYRCDAGRHFG